MDEGYFVGVVAYVAEWNSNSGHISLQCGYSGEADERREPVWTAQIMHVVLLVSAAMDQVSDRKMDTVLAEYSNRSGIS